MKSNKLYLVASIIAWITAIFFLIDRQWSTGALWVGMGFMLYTFYSRK